MKKLIFIIILITSCVRQDLKESNISENIDCNEIVGDINIDSSLNVIDIVYIVDVILNNSYSNLEICQILAADLNFNSQLNVIDIVGLVNLVLDL